MVEVGLNESVGRDECPNVPLTVDEIVDDVVSTAAMGAAVLHYHARDADGAVAWNEVDFYLNVMNGLVSRACDAITYPTYLGSYEHIWQLHDAAQAGHGLQMAPFDVIQNVGLIAWEDDRGRFSQIDLGDALGADKSAVPSALSEMRRRGVRPVVAAFDVGHARWVRLAVRAGVLAEPVNVKLFLHQGWVLGPTPSTTALDAYLAELDGVDAEITVVPSTMHDRDAWLDLIDAALRRGLGIRVGLGDCPAIHYGMTNTDVVGEAIDMMDRYGLCPATPSDVVSRLDLPTRPPAPAGDVS